jgi:membrane protease YdiL (CAAX protease family)
VKDQSQRGLLRIPAALLMGLAISIISLKAPGIFQLTEASPAWLGAFITHSFMWTLPILLILLLIRGRLRDYGFATREFRFTARVFLWVIPTAVLSVIGFLATRAGAEVKGGFELSPLQSIIFVWFYASTCEEIFTRGLLQSYLSPLTRYGIKLSSKLRLSLPVLFSGLYFGLMHIVAIDKMGPPVIVLTSLLGIVAGYYREKTGSLIPAIIIHALFNVGGMLPMWLLTWLVQ